MQTNAVTQYKMDSMAQAITIQQLRDSTKELQQKVFTLEDQLEATNNRLKAIDPMSAKILQGEPQVYHKEGNVYKGNTSPSVKF